MKNESPEIAAMTAAIEAAPATAELYYRRGRQYWKEGDKGHAISDYERAAQLDSTSPAVEALKLCRDIMDFYNTDLYNP